MGHQAQERDVSTIGQTSGTEKEVIEEPQQLVHVHDSMNLDYLNQLGDQIECDQHVQLHEKEGQFERTANERTTE